MNKTLKSTEKQASCALNLNIHVPCMLFITGGIPFTPGVVSIFSVYVAQLRSCRCNYFVHCIHHYPEEDPLSDDNGEPVYHQCNSEFQIISGALGRHLIIPLDLHS